MEKPLRRPNTPISAQPSRDVAPRQLMVTTSVVIFAISDWSLWILLREGPWGPPMRLILGNESVGEAVDRTLGALLRWPDHSTLLQLKAGWQEQQVQVWGSTEQGTAVSLINCVLLRANRDGLRPNLHLHPVPSLRVAWTPLADIESGKRSLDKDVHPVLMTALEALRSTIQRDPELVLRYLADMGDAPRIDRWWLDDIQAGANTSKLTQPLGNLKEPVTGNGNLTLAEAALLYQAFFAANEQVDLSGLRRRFLATRQLEELDLERPVRGREIEWRRTSKVYRYLKPPF